MLTHSIHQIVTIIVETRLAFVIYSNLVNDHRRYFMIRKLMLYATIASSLSFASITHATGIRNYISIVGSSTVYPFATVVAEQFA